MKIFTVIGARPQFIKAAPVSKVLRATGHKEYIIHTGQHYDHNMSQIFFDELEIPKPDVNLGVGSESHGKQTGEMLIRLEKVMQEEPPDGVIVYGDTNSTLAGALAAVKLHIPVAHIEAGMRSYNQEMPEEHNRVLTDHCSDLLFCATQTAVNNLVREGITKGVHLVGDTMYDAVLQFAEIARKKSTILQRLKLTPKGYLLATVHRPYNTDNVENLCNILAAFYEIEVPIIFPVHPRTRNKLAKIGMCNERSYDSVQKTPEIRNPTLIDPVSYLDMLVLEENARMILTDSGGMQKEAYFFAVPCVTLRSETEWVETVEAGWNIVVGADKFKIIGAVKNFKPLFTSSNCFGDGKAAQKCIKIIEALA